MDRKGHMCPPSRPRQAWAGEATVKHLAPVPPRLEGDLRAQGHSERPAVDLSRIVLRRAL